LNTEIAEFDAFVAKLATDGVAALTEQTTWTMHDGPLPAFRR